RRCRRCCAWGELLQQGREETKSVTPEYLHQRADHRHVPVAQCIGAAVIRLQSKNVSATTTAIEKSRAL
ncbi:hypothetical protein, partial [Xanthomonas oryzae]|uniref:hypothetical protein n=1 Tax=Xanthomonas oryzae TaxID=347 RepID=UPI001C4A2A4D